MGRRLTILLALLVILPTALLGWLAMVGARDERQRLAGQLRAAAESRLLDVDARVQRLLEDKERGLLDLTAEPAADAEGWRDLVRTTPELAQVAVQTVDGRLVHPPLQTGISESEREFLMRIRQILVGGLLDAEADAAEARESQQSAAPAADHGWYSWYWDTGLHLLFWRRVPAGDIIAVELDRSRLVADLVVELSTEPLRRQAAIRWGRIVLEDSQGRTLFQSAAEEPEEEAVESVARLLSPPLGAWNLRVEYWSEGSALALGRFLRLAGLLIVAAVLGGLAFVFHRESSRELREASQRVGFVNQVSHELRTPLTNIRLYAELLERRIDTDDRETRSYIEIIVAESARLSRLIGNVLSFARRRRGAMVIHPVEQPIDDTLRSVAEQFGPSFDEKGVATTLDLNAPRPVAFDPDALEQVVGNLLSNVEKYAAAGGAAAISSRQSDSATVIRVEDRGPGIPAGREETVFEPFVRLSDSLTEGVSGTGIGLSIARELVRLHGGDLRLVASDRGAVFEIELPLQQAEGS